MCIVYTLFNQSRVQVFGRINTRIGPKYQNLDEKQKIHQNRLCIGSDSADTDTYRPIRIGIGRYCLLWFRVYGSVNWDFINNLMKARGFPDRWNSWILAKLNRVSSRVVIIGVGSDFFRHKQGLRQGYPLSPMLFIIAADILQKMVGVANNSLSSPISTKLSDSIVAFKYADDTAIIANADETTLITLKIILGLFFKISGLAQRAASCPSTCQGDNNFEQGIF